MEELESVIGTLTKRVEIFSEKKGFGDSYAYRYGAFNAALYEVLDGLLTPQQVSEMEYRAKRMYQSVIDL